MKIIDKYIYLQFLNKIPKKEIKFILSHVREYFNQTMPIILRKKPFPKSNMFCHRYQNFEVALYTKYIVLYIYYNNQIEVFENFNNNKYLLN